MAQSINWRDSYHRTQGHVILTQEELQIPGVRTFGWMDTKRAGPALQQHFHENAFEITFVAKGSVILSTETQQYAVYGGDAFLTRPNEIHSTNESPLTVGEICWLQLDVSDLREFLFLSPQAAEMLVEKLRRVEHHCIRTDNRAVTGILKSMIAQAFPETPTMDRFQLASWIVVFLQQLLHFADAAGLRITADIAKACEYIQANVTEELPLDLLASVSCLSVSQFKHKFKSQMGISPGNYVNQQKIERIKQILTPASVLTAVAAEFSFCSSSYFSMVFKKYTGQTPSQFLKKQHTKER